MTVIAYREGVLAADRECSWNSRVHYATKIFRGDGFLIGAAGSIHQCETMMRWIIGGGKDAPPSFGEKSDFDVLVVPQNGRPLIYADSHFAVELKEAYTAIGSGASVALGAMYWGADAETAVKAAIKHGIGCGGPIDVLALTIEFPRKRAPKKGR